MSSTQTGSGGIRANVNYQDRLKQIQKYAASQGIPLDSPRLRKYALSQGVNPEDLGVEIVEAVSRNPDEATRRYAEKMGLSQSDPAVRKYANAGSEEEPEVIDIEGSDDARFKEAVLHYAKSQNLELTMPQVQKYARGLLKPSGDFSEDNKPVATPEAQMRRFDEAVRRYAERVGLDVNSEQVQKYASGLKKTGILPTPAKAPTVRRNVHADNHADQ